MLDRTMEARDLGSGRELGGKSIAIIGFMGAGKSTVGRLVALGLQMPFIDIDEEVEREAGMSVVEIFSREGEEGFRKREARALKRALEGGGAVIACGGGVVTAKRNIALLRERSKVFLLEVSVDEALRRSEKDGRVRPLLCLGDPAGRARCLMDERRSAYAAAAHEVIDAERAAPEEIAEEIIRRWKR